MTICPNCSSEKKNPHHDRNVCICGCAFDGKGIKIGKCSAGKVLIVEKQNAKNSSQFHNKPGSALESLIPDWVVQFKKGCGCKDYSKKMDRWGTEGCLAREKEIVGHLMGQSDKLIPIFRSIPKSLREAAAKKLLAKAIEMSRKV